VKCDEPLQNVRFMAGKKKQNFVIVCQDCQELLEAHISFESSSNITKHGFMDMTKQQSSNGGAHHLHT
jgi:hypothetical protein